MILRHASFSSLFQEELFLKGKEGQIPYGRLSLEKGGNELAVYNFIDVGVRVGESF